MFLGRITFPAEEALRIQLKNNNNNNPSSYEIGKAAMNLRRDQVDHSRCFSQWDFSGILTAS